jgi:Fe-S-cluster-containing hydrogenase component 2
MLRALNLEAQKCTGCLQCELACSYENEGVFNPARSRIKVFNFHHEGRFAPYTCTQCEDAWCLHACPVEAIVANTATGAKEVLEDICVGCKVCTIACPFGTVNYNQASGKVIKCDLCGGDPWCAKACPTGAISYVDLDNTGLDRMRAWAQQSPAGPASYNTPRSPTTPADFTRQNG